MNPFSFPLLTLPKWSWTVFCHIRYYFIFNSFINAGLVSSKFRLHNAFHGGGSLTDSPPFSPSEIADLDPKFCRSNYSLSTHSRATVNGSGSAGSVGSGKTVGRWLKERKERRKEENRIHNAQLHAAISVAGVAAAIAAVASASGNSSGEEDILKEDKAMASAATLVAAQCVEAAEAMGANHDHLASVISSAVNVKSAGDIMTLTAAAATALRGAATLKSRATKEVWSVAAINAAAEKGIGASWSSSSHDKACNNIILNQKFSDDFHHQLQQRDCESSNHDQLQHEHGSLNVCFRGLLANYGCDLLKRTRNGDLHWKIVSIYIKGSNKVVLKMKSRHVAGTITKKKKHMVMGVVKDMPTWPGRQLVEGGEERRYFGVKTLLRGVVEFECRNQREYDTWTNGVSSLLLLAAQRICRF